MSNGAENSTQRCERNRYLPVCGSTSQIALTRVSVRALVQPSTLAVRHNGCAQNEKRALIGGGLERRVQPSDRAALTCFFVRIQASRASALHIKSPLPGSGTDRGSLDVWKFPARSA